MISEPADGEDKPVGAQDNLKPGGMRKPGRLKGRLVILELAEASSEEITADFYTAQLLPDTN